MPNDAPDEPEDSGERATVPDSLAGMRLDAVAAQLFDGHSRARLKSWIESGALLLNGRQADRPRQPVSVGDELLLQAEEPTPVDWMRAEDLPLDIVHADADLAVIAKPAGLTVHPGAGQPGGTLMNALLHHFPETAALPRAGIVHRLDKDTSGLLVTARTLTAHTRLVQALARREVRREYDALVSAAVVAGSTIDLPIGRHPRDRLKMAVVDGGRASITHYRVQERFEHHSWLRVRLETGRTHQIRVHLAHLRMPIVGDALYGGAIARGKGMSETLRTALMTFPRQALHARELAFLHPASGAELCFTREPPQDMQQLLEALRHG